MVYSELGYNYLQPEEIGPLLGFVCVWDLSGSVALTASLLGNMAYLGR